MKKSVLTYIKFITCSISILGVSSCSNTRFLKEGEMLYTGSKLTIEGDSLSKTDKAELKIISKKISSQNLIRAFWDFVLACTFTTSPANPKSKKD